LVLTLAGNIEISLTNWEISPYFWGAGRGFLPRWPCSCRGGVQHDPPPALWSTEISSWSCVPSVATARASG